MQNSEVQNNLAAFRQKRGFSAAQLAKSAGVSRQTIYAMEAGSYVPNTLLALKLARLLDARVEDLFALGQEDAHTGQRLEPVTVFPGSERLQPGQPVQLCRVEKRLMALSPSAVPWYFPASDAVIAADPVRAGKGKVQVFDPAEEFTNRVLIAGCDPGISVLSRHVMSAGVELVLAHRNSSQSLELLKEGYIHVAGTHLRDAVSGESNIPEIGRLFSRNSVAVISFAVWEEGIVVGRDNPKQIRSIEDLARPDVRIVNREDGAGSRKLLDSELQRHGVASSCVQGYETTAPGHLPAAWQVFIGAVDACLAPRAAARLFGLGFVPLVSERYDLAIRRQHLDLPGIQILLDTLSRSKFRRELESFGGYDTKAAGQKLL